MLYLEGEALDLKGQLADMEEIKADLEGHIRDLSHELAAARKAAEKQASERTAALQVCMLATTIRIHTALHAACASGMGLGSGLASRKLRYNCKRYAGRNMWVRCSVNVQEDQLSFEGSRSIAVVRQPALHGMPPSIKASAA